VKHSLFVVALSVFAASCTPSSPAAAPIASGIDPSVNATASASPSAEPPAASRGAPGPLAIEPSFDKLDYSAWVGVAMWENLISFGWSADSTVFANCQPDTKASVFTKGCDLFHTDDTPRSHVTSTTDYGDGHPPTKDAALDAALKPLGIPAEPGKWPYSGAITLVWTAQMNDDSPESIAFSIREDATGDKQEIARFTRDEGGGYPVYPRAAVVSPDGTKLAIVVSYVGAPPLQTLAKIVGIQSAAKQLLGPGQ
jgi:hypothetical protein